MHGVWARAARLERPISFQIIAHARITLFRSRSIGHTDKLLADGLDCLESC